MRCFKGRSYQCLQGYFGSSCFSSVTVAQIKKQQVPNDTQFPSHASSFASTWGKYRSMFRHSLPRCWSLSCASTSMRSMLGVDFFSTLESSNFQETQKLLSGSEGYRPDVVELARTWAREKWGRKRVKFCKRNLDIQVNAFLVAHRYKVCCLLLPGFSIGSLNGQFCGRLNMKILMRLTQFKSPILFPQDLKSNFEIVQSTDCAE